MNNDRWNKRTYLFFLNLLILGGLSTTRNLHSASTSNQLQKLDTLEAYKLDQVSVTAKHIKRISAAKAGIREMDLPQAITTLDNKLLEAQQVNSVTDLLKNINGLYISGATGGYQEEIASRGTNLTSTNTFKNGIRYFGGMKTEFSGIESAEILKGNSALLYGNVAPGGVLNLITRKPKTELGGEVSMASGSFDQLKPRFDVYGPLNKTKTIAFRLNGSYEQANSFRDYVNSTIYYLNPSFLFSLGKMTTLLIEGDYTKDSRTPDFGAGIVNYQIANIPRNRFLGVSWGRYRAEQSFASAKLTHKFNKYFHLSSLTGWRYYNTDLLSNSRPNTSGSVIAPDGSWRRNIQQSKINDKYFIEQVDLNAFFKTMGIAHQALFGVDYEAYTTKTTAYKTVSGYDTINIFSDYNAALERASPDMIKNTLTAAPVFRYGVYAQDLIGINKYLKLLLGLRYSGIKSESNVYTYSTRQTANSKAVDCAFSPKAGIILQPSRNHSIFASYSNSFTINTGVDIQGNSLAPSIIDQYELGVKNNFLDRKLAVNLTAYQISNNRLAQISLENGNTNTTIKELAGATRGRGVELDITYRPLENFYIMGGYSYTKTIYTASNTYIVGSELRYNPHHTANVSANYIFDKGLLKNFQAGFISSYMGQRYAGRSTRVTTPNDTYKLIPLDAFLQHDIVLGYTLKSWNLKAKFSNISNAMSYNVHDDNSLNPIAPFNYNLNVSYKF